MKKVFILIVSISVFLYGFKIWLDGYIHRPLPLNQPQIIELVSGAGIRALSQKMTEQGLVAHPLIVRFTAKLYDYDTKLKAGEYQITEGMSLLDVFQMIVSGKVVLHQLTLPEGLTTHQMFNLIAQNEFLSGEISIAAGEGELLPETYTFHRGMDRNLLISLAQKAMREKLEHIWNERDPDLPLNSSRDLLILASIIEKETGVGSERAEVASVFINRLRIGMMLQTDPTVIYALTLGKEELGRPLYRKDLEIDSPYNTYKYAGLPPTPIATPGEKALEAAAHPADTPYFYFVANGAGGHNFAKNLAEHNKNVQDWKRKSAK